jgi:hypothetical protein
MKKSLFIASTFLAILAMPLAARLKAFPATALMASRWATVSLARSARWSALRSAASKACLASISRYYVSERPVAYQHHWRHRHHRRHM